jgi:formylglycine-generating enzyme required for sulfatase activity
MREAATLLVLTVLLVTLAWPPPAAAGGNAVRAHTIAGLPVVRIPAGKVTPLYPPAPGVTEVQVAAFVLMTRPVTNGDFLDFVKRSPGHRRDRIARVFAEPRYLAHWAEPVVLGRDARPAQPVANVSWFAARAFCRAAGLRLPLAVEWELAAAASRTRRDGSKEAAHRQAILAWYGKPREALPDVPHGPANLYGVHDLHGVVWEWIEDFNEAVIASDTREQGESARDRFCGAGAAMARGDATDYAAFMRVAMRSSLEAHYTGAMLGFRCAADPPATARSKP